MLHKWRFLAFLFANARCMLLHSRRSAAPPAKQQKRQCRWRSGGIHQIYLFDDDGIDCHCHGNNVCLSVPREHRSAVPAAPQSTRIDLLAIFLFF
jgi:hypothetical protein